MLMYSVNHVKHGHLFWDFLAKEVAVSIDKKLFELSEKDALRWGLTYLLNQAMYANMVKDEALCLKIPASEHPFGIPLTAGKSALDFVKSSVFERTIYLVENLETTTFSVETLARLLWVRLENSTEKQIQYLRVIRLEAVKDDKSMHTLFYEVGLENDILICGGCTDCSGGGLYGKRTMDSLFLLLSSVFEVTIETTEIPFERARSIITSLYERITAYHKE